MSAESPRHVRSGGPLTVPSQPPSDRSIIDAVSGFINDVTLSSSSNVDPKDVIQWARFEIADINEPTPEGDGDNDISPLLLILGYGSGVQVWLIRPSAEAQEVLSWRQGTVRILRILPTPQSADCFAAKRPLIALCDSASPGPSFCSLSFISIRGGEQVKSIKFKNPILDVLANKRSVVVSFSERFAVFDAGTLEDRMAVTTCFPCPCPLGGSQPINPLALGDRWLAYADKKLNQSKRSSGGCEGEGVTSYTATVLHAAKSLSKGLRGLGESVAQSLSGVRSTSQSPSPPNTDVQQPGVVTILDIEQGNDEDDGQDTEEPCDPLVAHFVAHSEAIIALKFDDSGLLLVTADRRGHDFHVFRINPHPCGPSLASVHHLYILHRGDTTARVQDIAISVDGRWTAVSTLRGTTHVFAISPYGGACGVRTHTSPRVVNRLSRFHRSAGLPIHGHAKRPSGSPVGEGVGQGAWFPNPRLPPYPLPVQAAPLAQLRPTANLPTHTITRTSAGRQRLSSLSEDSNSVPLLARARFGLVAGTGRIPGPPAAALYLMTATGDLLHLLLHPKPMSNIPKEKLCDESPIELLVEPIGQWSLQRPSAAADLLAPLPPSNPLLQPQTCRRCADMCMSEEERWLSQVEIVTHAGPHRRLWMGPQFVFKTYNFTGSCSSLSEAEAVEIEARGVARSTPVNMPARPLVPVLVDSGSASSLEVEHSPSDSRRKSLLADTGRASVCDVQLREDLAEAMKEDHGWVSRSSSPGHWEAGEGAEGVTRAVDPLGTVVRPTPAPPPPPLDADAYTSSNCDEATFRPVVRAPASLPPPPPPARPLPTTTTIPVQTLRGPPAPRRPPPEPLPLTTTVVIPAELHHDRPPLPDDLESQTNNASATVTESLCESTSLPKSTRPPADIQSTIDRDRVKKSPTPKDRVSDVSSRDKKSSKIRSTRTEDFEEVPRVSKEPPVVEVAKSTGKKDITSKPSEFAEPVKDGDLDFEELKEIPVMREPKQGKALAPKERETKPSKVEKSSKKEPDTKESIVVSDDKQTLAMPKKEASPCKTIYTEEKIKCEEQAWDMLLTEPDRPILNVSHQVTISEKNIEDIKPKSKKGRKGKKSQEEIQSKEDEDSFVEIHAIEEKQQPSSGELVSISSPFEDIDATSSYSKAKKTRAAKSMTPERKIERKEDVEIKVEEWPLVEPVPISFKSKSSKKFDDASSDIEIMPEQPKIKSKEKATEKARDSLKVESAESGSSESSSPVRKESSKSKKSKSSSPNPENEVKDVYVINTTTDDFPEIKITRGSKQRKKSPQPESRSQDKEVTGKSWSSIADRKSQEKEIIIEQHAKSWSTFTEKKVKEEKEVEKPEKTEILVSEKSRQKEVVDEKPTNSASEKKTQEKEVLAELPPKSWSSIKEKKSQEKEVVKDKASKSWSFVTETKTQEKKVLSEMPGKSWSSIAEKKSKDKEVAKEKQSKSWSSVAEKKMQEKDVLSELPEKSWSSLTEKKSKEKEVVNDKTSKSWTTVDERKALEKEELSDLPEKSWSSITEKKSKEKEVIKEKPSKSWSSVAERKSQQKEELSELPGKSWNSITEGKMKETEVVKDKSSKSWSSVAEKKTQDKDSLFQLPAESWSSITEKKNQEKVKEKPTNVWGSFGEKKEQEKEEKPTNVWGSFGEKKEQEKDIVTDLKLKSWSSITDKKSQDKEIGKQAKSWTSVEKKSQEKDMVRPEKPAKSAWSFVADQKSEEKEAFPEIKVKSWSSIAASNTNKEIGAKVGEKKSYKAKNIDKSDDEASTFQDISLQEKLIELCKRTDIMVAECDAPSEPSDLNFVDEHHALVNDMPLLEPLDFGLDDFKLDVMRDSLIEEEDTKETSPICKINIDDILSSIKETTNRAIESSSFNLIDLEKVPAKKEQGFSVVENDKITSQEVKVDDDKSDDSKEGEMMEKSSDDDVTSPIVSTDSDKEDKKSAGASNVTMPSSKQSIKSKKSRRKKK